MRLSAPELAARYRDGHARRRRQRDRRRPGRQRDALLARRLARARRRADVHRLAQPEGLHRREARARGRDRALGRLGHPGRPPRWSKQDGDRGRDAARAAAGSSEVDIYEDFQEAALRFIDADAVRSAHGAAEGRRRRRQRHGRPDGRAAAGEPRPRADRDLLDARRRVPRPRAEPAAAGEPELHHRAGSARRAPTSASPGTATPTAASSSTRPAQFVDGDFLTALLAESLLAKAGSDPAQPEAILYDVRASRAVADTVERAGGVPYVNRVGHAFFKTRMRKEGSLFGGEVSGHYYFRDFYCADSGTIPALLVLEMLATGSESMSELPRALPRALLHLRRDQLRGLRPAGEDGGDRRALLRRPPGTPRRHLDRLRGLALQRAPVEHRAAAAPVPGVARLARGHGTPPRRGARA